MGKRFRFSVTQRPYCAGRVLLAGFTLARHLLRNLNPFAFTNCRVSVFQLTPAGFRVVRRVYSITRPVRLRSSLPITASVFLAIALHGSILHDRCQTHRIRKLLKTNEFHFETVSLSHEKLRILMRTVRKCIFVRKSDGIGRSGTGKHFPGRPGQTRTDNVTRYGQLSGA